MNVLNIYKVEFITKTTTNCILESLISLSIIYSFKGQKLYHRRKIKRIAVYKEIAKKGKGILGYLNCCKIMVLFVMLPVATAVLAKLEPSLMVKNCCRSPKHARPRAFGVNEGTIFTHIPTHLFYED